MPSVGSHTLAFALLSPGFAVAGLLLAALPIIIHILNRRRFKTVSWAAMEFLLRAMRKNRRRLRFEQWLLLVTRCALLVLLGLALARPLACESGALAGLGRRTALDVIVIDNSYSMGYEVDKAGAKTHLDRAKAIAKAILSRSDSGGTSASIIVAGRPAKSLFGTPTYDLQSAVSAVDRIEQSYAATDLAGALDAALKLAREHPEQPNRNLYILTDGTRSAFQGSQSSQLKELGPQLAQMYHLAVYNLAQGSAQWNAAVTGLSPASNLVTDKFPSDFKATIRCFGLVRDASVQWRLDDHVLGDPQPVHLDATTDVTQSHASFPSGGPHVLALRLFDEDRLQVDNQFQRVVDVTSELKTLIVEGKHGATELEGSGAFLKLALAPPKNDKGDTDSYVSPELISDLELGNKVLTDYSAVLLAGVGQITASEADRLRDYVEHGGTLMFFMGDAVDKENYNSMLLPRKLIPGPLVKLVSVGTDQRGALFDFKPNGVVSRFLNEFARQPESGLDSAQVFTYWQIELPHDSTTETVLSYLPAAGAAPGAAEDPAITFQSVGQGHVVFVSTTASPDWTNLPAKLAYLPLIHELLTGSVRAGDYWMNLEVGQRLVIPPNVSLAGAPSLMNAAQQPVTVLEPDPNSPDVGARTYHSEPITKPGVYTLSLGNRQVPLAVNLPAEEEADVFVLDDGAIRKALGDAQMTMHGDELPTDAAAAANDRNDLGWWCMALLLAMIGFECFLAMRFGHYRRFETGMVVAGA
jgi:hypothetical protein